MANQIDTETEPSVTSLLSGILQDARELIAQQLTLFQVELKNDLRRTVSALIPLVIGSAVMFVALFLLGTGAAHLLCWIFPDLPTWAGFAIVGGTVALISGLLILWGKTMLQSNNPLPDKTLEGLKENFQWKTKT